MEEPAVVDPGVGTALTLVDEALGPDVDVAPGVPVFDDGVGVDDRGPDDEDDPEVDGDDGAGSDVDDGADVEGDAGHDGNVSVTPSEGWRPRSP